jgi:hypothetical protein
MSARPERSPRRCTPAPESSPPDPIQPLPLGARRYEGNCYRVDVELEGRTFSPIIVARDELEAGERAAVVLEGALHGNDATPRILTVTELHSNGTHHRGGGSGRLIVGLL